MSAEYPEKLSKIQIPPLTDEISAFTSTIIGQEEAVNAFAMLLAKLRSGIRKQEPGPLATLFLAGPSGVGKTEITYALAAQLAGEQGNPRSKIIKLNCGEYQEDHMISRLIGAPPGYRGSEDAYDKNFQDPALFAQANLDNHRIFFTDRNEREQNVVIILIDEAEKASDALHRALLGVLDKGQMTIGTNRNSDFSNAVIIFTSNVGNQQAEQLRDLSSDPQLDTRQVIISAFKNAFPPETRGRIKDLIVFKSLTEEAIKQIAALKLSLVETDFAHNGIPIGLELSPSALEWIIAQGYNPSEGARALGKVIEKQIHDQLILIHLKFGIKGKQIYVDKGEEDIELVFYFNGEEQSEIPSAPEQDAVWEGQGSSANPLREPLKVTDRVNVVLRGSFQAQNASARTPASSASSKPEQIRPSRTNSPASRHPTSEQKIPVIPTRIKTELLEQFKGLFGGINRYVEKRDNLIHRGLLNPGEADTQPAIRSAVTNELATGL